MKTIFALLCLVVPTVFTQFLARKTILDLVKEENSQKQATEYPHDEDLNTFSNYHDVRTEHIFIDWTINFNKQEISGAAHLDMTSQIDKLDIVNLDIWNLLIDKIYISSETIKRTQLKNFVIVTFTDQGEQGQQLQINLDQKFKSGEKFTLEIQYSFGDQSQAVSFLTPEQTGTKTQPYLFSQAEPIYCRSMVPLQDTPQIKSTYTAQVTAPQDINVYMSANKTDVVQQGENRVHYFDNSIPIPSYLIAVIAGNVVEQQVGEKTYVIAEPDMIEKSSNDLRYLQEYLESIESYIQIPYIWGSYKIVIMPPSFPIGGMENPLLTFASPSIIVGDMSGTTVAIHEIAHSWTGNMITCGNWSNLWINEGFTVFLERKSQKILFGEDFMLMDSIVGNNSLQADFNYFGMDSNFSSLFPLVANRNPDDAFSTVPYDKGYQFLYFLETLLGETDMATFLKEWIQKYTFTNAVWENFQEFFTSFVTDNIQSPQEILDQVNWDAWVLQPGNTPIDDIEAIHFSTPSQTEALNLADSFIELGGDSKPDDWSEGLSFTPNQQYVFIGQLYDRLEDVTPKILELINSCYNFNESPNMELQWRWYEVTIYAGYEDPKEDIFEFLGEIGRQKMITPQYKAYVATGQREYAQSTFLHYYDFYHQIARITIAQIVFEE